MNPQTLVRDMLKETPVSYQKIADMIHGLEIPHETLVAELLPILWDHLATVGWDSYRYDYHHDPLLKNRYVLTKQEPPVIYQELIVWYADRLLHGFSGMGTFYGVRDTWHVYPSDGLLECSSLYAVHAHYQSGDSFGTYPDQECLAGLIQGYTQLKRFLDLLRERDGSRMSPLNPDAPNYALKCLLGLDRMQEWEGYFDRLDGYHVGIVYEVGK
jgi:hypothetical protein